MKVLAMAAVIAVIAQQALPVPSPIPGTQLLETTKVDGPLEVRSATADEEAVLAGTSYTRRRYSARPEILLPVFVATYRDALFAGGWKLIAVPKVDGVPAPDGIINIAAQYMENARNIYVRISRSPDGSYEISAADVGEEDWPARLANDCRVRVHSLHFDLDRPTLKQFESMPTLTKLSDALKRRGAPVVEIEGHVDNIGEAAAAARQALSDARAKTVAGWLIADGVPESKVRWKGYGKLRPIADNDTDLGRALNRRIEVACAAR